MNAQIALAGHVATCGNCKGELVPSRATGEVWVHEFSGGSTLCNVGGSGRYSFATNVRPA